MCPTQDPINCALLQLAYAVMRRSEFCRSMAARKNRLRDETPIIR